MPKRAERRHHEERIKGKFRKIVKRWAGKVDAWTHKCKLIWEDGKIVSREYYIDRSGGAERMRHIDKEANQLAHHHKCDCWMCHRERYRSTRHRKKVLDKMYIEEDGEE